MKSLVLPGLGLLAAVFAVVSIVRSQPRRVPTDPPSPPPSSAFAHAIAAAGIVEAASENVSIGTPLNGIVEQVHVVVGEEVRSGQPLFSLDSRALKAVKAARQAAVEAADSRQRTATNVLADLEDQLERAERLARTEVISPDELTRRQFAVRIAAARLAEAEAEVRSSRAALAESEVELERSIIRSPLDATVLRVGVRPGEFAAAGVSRVPLLVLGQTHPLHVRVDVDEHEGWRVVPTASASGQVRGDSGCTVPLRFVRFEPLVVPKMSLSGDATERVDTRVLQVIYEVVGHPRRPLYVGQQLDVFIDSPDLGAKESSAPAK